MDHTAVLVVIGVVCQWCVSCHGKAIFSPVLAMFLYAACCTLFFAALAYCVPFLRQPVELEELVRVEEEEEEEEEEAVAAAAAAADKEQQGEQQDGRPR